MNFNFKKVILTPKGESVLTDAFKGTPVVWGEACTTDVDVRLLNSTDFTNILTKDSFLRLQANKKQTSFGHVTQATSGVYEVYDEESQTTISKPSSSLEIQLTNEDYNYSGYAYSLCIMGGSSELDQSLLIVAYLDDNAEPDLISDTSKFNSIINCTFTLSQTLPQNIISPDSWYASVNAFNELSSRVVTAYSKNDNTKGDTQSILGEKTFIDTVYHKSSILPTEKEVFNLGSETKSWNSIFTANVFTDSISSLNPILTDNTCNSIIVGSNENNECALFPPDDERCSIGLDGQRFSSLYAYEIYGHLNGNADTATNIVTTPSLVATNCTGYNDDQDASLTLTIGDKASTTNIETVRRAYWLYCNVANGNLNYPMIFASFVNKNSQMTSQFRNLYTDMVNSFYYNPYTNTLTCSNFNGIASSAKTVGILGSSTNGNLPLVFAGSKNTSITTFLYKTLYTDTEDSLYYNPSTNRLTCKHFDVKGTTNLYGGSTKNYIISSNVLDSPSLYPSEDNSGYLGINNRKFSQGYINTVYSDNIVTDNINGRTIARAIADSLVGNSDNPVGCLRMLLVWYNNGMQKKYSTSANTYRNPPIIVDTSSINAPLLFNGEVRTSQHTPDEADGDLQTFTANIGTWNNRISTGKWALLGALPINDNNQVTTEGRFNLMLAIRIE